VPGIDSADAGRSLRRNAGATALAHRVFPGVIRLRFVASGWSCPWVGIFGLFNNRAEPSACRTTGSACIFCVPEIRVANRGCGWMVREFCWRWICPLGVVGVWAGFCGVAILRIPPIYDQRPLRCTTSVLRRTLLVMIYVVCQCRGIGNFY